MPESSWRQHARSVINWAAHEWEQRAGKSVLEPLTPEERRDLERAIRDAYPFGERAMWPYQCWLRERRAFLRSIDPHLLARVAAIGRPAPDPQPAATPLGGLFAGGEHDA